jgi:uncharacterized 2Fe-2S/4Fe-4S cluster protein (DUF4445 family)
MIKTISLPRPSLSDNTADADRLIRALKQELKTDRIGIELELLRELPVLLRKYDYHIRCLLFQDRKGYLLVSISGADETKPLIGLAVDLGTTRVVLRLIDLIKGNTLGESTFDNPQIAIGPDILTRIHFADTEGGLEHLHALIINSINEELARLCQTCAITPKDVYLLSLAGNTAMTHLFMGLSPHRIIREPYIPVINTPEIMTACKLGIKANPLSKILIFPNIGSYFGGDLIAGILFSGMNLSEETAILVDVGTNAEVVIGNRHWMIACAGAAGPALEGGLSRMGMMAGPGVIDRASIRSDAHEFDIHTIDDKKPIGICGSGVIDLAACLFLSGMMDIRGKLVPAACGNRFKEKDDMGHLIVVPASESATGKDLCLSQADLDSLKRSKAAMFTILETISGAVGLLLSDLKTFYVAGTFGCFINPKSAITIGMLPDLPLETFKPLGNSSLGGAVMALTQDCIKTIDAIRNQITYLELNVNQDFMNRFSAAKFFPHTDISRFPSVKQYL